MKIPENRLSVTGNHWRRWGIDLGWYHGVPGLVVVEFWEPVP